MITDKLICNTEVQLMSISVVAEQVRQLPDQYYLRAQKFQQKKLKFSRLLNIQIFLIVAHEVIKILIIIIK